MMLFLRWRHRRHKGTRPEQPSSGFATAQTVPGTRRHLEGSDYLLPKDQGEEDRLNFQHYALYHAIGSHSIAPLSEQVGLILDVGTGTGIWPVEMARLFPQAHVFGVDCDTALFLQKEVPENCFLRAGNVLTRLPFPDAIFGYTHQRLLVAGIRAENWPGVVQELIRVTRSGGWVELVELDDQMQRLGPAGQRLQELMVGVSKSMGFDGEVIRHLGDLLISGGLEAVEVQPISLPVGEWGGRPGHMLKRDMLTVIEAVKPVYCERGQINMATFDHLVQTMALEWEQFHASCTFLAAYGKRVQR